MLCAHKLFLFPCRNSNKTRTQSRLCRLSWLQLLEGHSIVVSREMGKQCNLLNDQQAYKEAVGCKGQHKGSCVRQVNQLGLSQCLLSTSGGSSSARLHNHSGCMHCMPNQLGSRICHRVQATPTKFACSSGRSLLRDTYQAKKQCAIQIWRRGLHTCTVKQLHACMIINDCQCWSLCMQQHSD